MKNLKIELINNHIIHIEYGNECKKNTFFIPNKNELVYKKITPIKKDNFYCFKIKNYFFNIPCEAKKINTLKIDYLDKTIYKFKNSTFNGELPCPHKTPHIFAIKDCPRIILPKNGYNEKSQYIIEENVNDYYFILCEKDPILLRKLYVLLTGKNELVRLSTLGLWSSKYYVYTEETAMELIQTYKKYDLPLDNMVLDTDWRKSSETGIGYDINEKLFPNIKRFFDYAKKNNIEIMFNDHPEPKNNLNVFDSREIKYRFDNLSKYLNLGLSYWWYDRNWRTHLISPTQINPETLGMYIFEDITRQVFQKKAHNKLIYTRPIIMGNVDNIKSGDYKQITNVASHRYSIQWTGDILSYYYGLRLELANITKGLNNCVNYINSDIGGHIGNPDKYLYLRWIQYGVFSPILRPHCNNEVNRYRDPYLYDKDTLDIARKYIKLRYRLLLYMYGYAFLTYHTGIGYISPLNLKYHYDKNTRKINDEFLIGDNLLIAPLYGLDNIIIDKSHFPNGITGTYYNNENFQGEIVCTKKYDNINFSWNGLSPEINVNKEHFSAIFEGNIYFDKEENISISYDDGVRVYIDDKLIYDHFSWIITQENYIGKIKGLHKLRIEYCQDTLGSYLYLFKSKNKNENTRKVYLPKEKWINLFNGKIYKHSFVKEYKYDETALFVKQGSIIPLIKDENSTKQLNYQNIILDYYPGNVETKCMIYEDDFTTTAYKNNYFALNKIETSNNKIILYPMEGKYNAKNRTIGIRYNLINGFDKIKEIQLNNQKISFSKYKKNKKQFVLEFSKQSNIFDTIYFEFNQDINKKYIIEFIYE